jgi:hypothetical protein
MTTLTGFAPPDNIAAGDARRNPDTQNVATVIAGGAADGPLYSGGPITDTQPVDEPGLTLTGFKMISFEYDFYNTIWVTPNPVDLGNVVDGQTAQIYVWNAYLTSQLLSAINPVNDTGLTLSGPSAAPTLFSPLEQRIYDLVVSLNGPATINADYTFLFPSDTIVLQVSGYRVVLFAWRPNWKRQLLERLEFLTDVIEAENGDEQRIGLRKYPRRFVEFELLATDMSQQQLRALLWRWQARAWTLPLWTDSTALSAAAQVDDAVLYIASIPDELAIGGQAVIYRDPSVYEIVQVAAIGVDNFTLVNPLVGSFEAGTRVYPVKAARLVDNSKTQRHTPAVEGVVVRFRFDDISEVTAADSGATYRSLPVLEVRPNWGRDVTDEYLQKMALIDMDTGAVVQDEQSQLATVFTQMSWLKSTKAQIKALRQWIYARMGQLVPIWVPTWAHDLTLAQAYNTTDTEIYFKDIGYRKFYGQIGRRDIRIALKNGNVYYRRLSSPILFAPGVEKISIDSALGVSFGPNDVQMVSFLTLCRLNSDAVEIAYHTPEIAESTVTLRSLQHDL